ncbi:pentapeptide repeat-containing protein [Adhaeribacter radiodurans]|uniref:Pentapeptide repeat-containing protein n=1 Tax=Adhaeribacter radiodurans TaxID=2745197 RepID=A0A7L7L1J0_9BACT|nr:pentapeptide repeat-containing protein [Adhaeribacter radiodurans]QMU26651.1 pentapeptide repeat-containing protein [Adhaeribacter radiodurans]
MELLHEEELFDKIDFSGKKLAGIEFNACTFKNCNFAESSFAGALFIDCTFETCNLGLANLDQAKLQTVAFRNSKLLGLNFSRCDNFLFAISFYHCNLDFSSYVGKKLKKTTFDTCSIKEANFAECDLSEAAFLNCDLYQTLFNRTNLTKTDFRTAYNYAIDLEQNPAKKAKFSSAGLSGLLAKYDLVIE